MLAEDWLRVLSIGIVAFVMLVAVRRITGTRPITEMSAFDLIVLVALGGALGAVLVWESIGLLDGILAFAVLLILLQLRPLPHSGRKEPDRWDLLRELILLVRKGEILSSAIKQARVAPAEIVAAVPECGYEGVAQVEAVVLESDGSLTVIDAVGRMLCPSPANTTRLTSWRRTRNGR